MLLQSNQKLWMVSWWTSCNLLISIPCTVNHCKRIKRACFVLSFMRELTTQKWTVSTCLGWGRGGEVHSNMGYTRCADRLGMVFVLSVVNRIYNFAQVCPNGKQHIACQLSWFVELNVFVLQVYKSNDYNVNFLDCNCQLMTLKHDGIHFVLCPKQGNEIEVVVLNKVWMLGFCFLSWNLGKGQAFKLLSWI